MQANEKKGGKKELKKLIRRDLQDEYKSRSSSENKVTTGYDNSLYTRADVINALAVYHLTHSYKETQRRTGVSEQTIVRWITRARETQLLDEVKKYAEEWKMQTQSDLRVLASAALSQAYNTIDEASPLQAAQIAQIAMEQIRKFDGNADQMTQNNFFFTDSTLKGYNDEQKVALMERVAARHKAASEDVEVVPEGE